MDGWYTYTRAYTIIIGARNQHTASGAYEFHIHRAYIIYGGTMFSRVLACTLLHRELRDYSLGQIAFAVFRALFAITQLLCHVSALLTSACKQA